MAKAWRLALHTEDAEAKLAALVRGLGDDMQQGAVASLVKVHENIRRLAPKQSGRLGKKWKISAKPVRAGAAKADVALETWTKYAKVQDIGGTMRPKRGKYLAIGIGAAAPKGPSFRKRGPRQIAGKEKLFKLGNVMMMPLKGGGIAPYFLLVKSVTIKGKHFMPPSIRAGQAAIGASTEKAIEATVRDYKLN